MSITLNTSDNEASCILKVLVKLLLYLKKTITAAEKNDKISIFGYNQTAQK